MAVKPNPIFPLLLLACLACVGQPACRRPGPAPDPATGQGGAAPASAPGTKAARIDPARWVPELDQCPRDASPCRAMSELDQALRALPRDQRLQWLSRLLGHTSARVQAYALVRLYPYRHRAELLPRLEELMSGATDVTVLNLASTMLLLQNTGQAAAAFTRHYGRLPREVKQAIIWALRMNYSQLPLPFLESLKEDPEALVRSAALEIEAVFRADLESLVSCIRELRPEAGSCALAIARTSNAAAGTALLGLAAHFETQAREQKRLVRAPPELATAIELAHGQKRLDTAEAVDVLTRLLDNRRLEDEIRAQAAYSLGAVGGRGVIPRLAKHRKDPRKKVGYAARRAIYFIERDPE
jgi:hypothetical protein